MPNWLIILLIILVAVLCDGVVVYYFIRKAYNKGYEAGMSDSLEISRQVDDILRSG